MILDSSDLKSIGHQVEEEISSVIKELEKTSSLNHQKVLKAFQNNRISDYHLKGTTGYGYSDIGRDTLEKVFAEIFKGEKALVRSQIVSGTHAIALALFGILKPGDELLSISGRPYDTLEELIGIRGRECGSLKELGVTYREIGLLDNGKFDFESIKEALHEKTKLITLQRSRGYAWRPSLSIKDIGEIAAFVKSIKSDVIIFVDNCYGEFVESKEPLEVGADLIAGSLIKNPGGGLAPIGGYVIGRGDLVEMAANRLTAPGIGQAVGASLEVNRLFYQGLFIAPHVVKEALKGVIYAACLFEKLGFEVSPKFTEPRTDIIQAIKFQSPEKMIAFCQGLQSASPIDGHVVPEPSGMPGYEDHVIMAGGTFIQGSSIELSADGPLREPYIAYLQGGLAFEYTKIGVLNGAKNIINKN